jgi:hypothetical protein
VGCFTFQLGLFAAAVFVASLVVHALSLIPGTVLPMEQFVWLHVLTILVFLPVVVHICRVHNRAVRLGLREAELQPLMMRHIPCAVVAVGAALFVYAIANFAHFAATVEGSAEFRDGKYVLMKKGVVIREITEEQYHEHRRLDLQGLSGHWLVFSWLAVTHFFFVAPRVQYELDNMRAP